MLISLNIHCARILSGHREIERQKDKEGEEREGLGEIGRKGGGAGGGGGNRPRGALGFTANWDVATLLPPGQQRQRMGKLEGHGLNSI